MAMQVEGLGQAQVVRHGRAARRLRVLVPGLSGDEGMARRLEDALGQLPGVVDARADIRSGRVLIRYQAGAEVALAAMLPRRQGVQRPPVAQALARGEALLGRLRGLL